MAHVTARRSYENLVARLNRFPQGAPPSELLYKILSVLFSEREAELVSLLPIKPFTVEKAAGAWKIDQTDARKVLEELADRSILLDYPDRDGQTRYLLPPPMAGFFEFSMMRIREDVDQRLLAELLYEYLNVEEDFVRDLFGKGPTQLGRVFVQERALANENALHVLDYKRASEVIKSASHIGVGVCYCRHKMMHVGRDCDAPKNICMTFNSCAASLTRRGAARKVDAPECLDLLAEAQDHDLVQFGENVRQDVAFICNCCGCCCEAMIAARRFGTLKPIHTSGFIPAIDTGRCKGCGKCAMLCPVEAMTSVSANDPHKPKRKIARLNTDLCLGCGVCIRRCPEDALRLDSRPEHVITPLDSVHRTVLMAIERGKLQNLLFDNQVYRSHRALAAVLGVILRLPPIKQAMASEQMKSRFVSSLVAWAGD